MTVGVDRSGGDDNSVRTYYRTLHRPVGPAVKFRRQGTFSFFGKFFGQRDVLVGDPFFDDRVIVDSAHANDVRAFLTPARRAALLEIFERWRDAEITHDAISIEEQGTASRSDLVANVRRLVDIAHVLGDPDAVDAALTKQDDGYLADAAIDLHKINETESNTFVTQLEAEALIETRDYAAAEALFERIHDQIPEREVADQGWEELAHAPAPVTLPAEPVRASTPQITGTQQQVIDDLFDTGRLSYEIIERFEQVYIDRSVLWHGKVTSLQTYRHDTDFGAGPGTKVTVLLGTAGSARVVSNEVHAVIELPPETSIERGSSISFSGQVVRVDRFARKLYVEAGQLEP